MRKLLLTTVAAAALAGYAGVASAQTMQGPPAGAGAAAKSENAKPAESKGALSGAIKGDVPGGHAQNSSADHTKAAEDASPTAKPDQKLGEDQTKPITTPRNAEEEKPGATAQKTGEEKSGAEERGAQKDSAKDSAKPGMSSTAQSTAKAAGSHGSVKLSQTQRTKIQSIVGRSSGARVSNVHFDVSVGVKIPSDVHVVVLPERIVEVVPEFRGYDYIIVGDNILIIDPDTHEIVDIIAA